MSVLSDADIIARNPIGKRLDGFRLLFTSKCYALGISEVEDHTTQVNRLVEASGTDGPKAPEDHVS